MPFGNLKFSPNTVTLRLASLRFFYIKRVEVELEHRRDAPFEEGDSPCINDRSQHLNNPLYSAAFIQLSRNESFGR